MRPERRDARRSARLAVWFAAACACLLAAPARAQAPRAWVPPVDSMRVWSEAAVAGFRAVTSDSVGGRNSAPYEIVGRFARRMLRAMGPRDLLQAHAIVPVLDSLGLDVDVAVDPAQPTFALVMVRNPFRFTAHAIGFLYWTKVEDFRMQGAEFQGGMDPQMRVWWTGKSDRPYEWAVLEHQRGAAPVHFTLFRLTAGGTYWNLTQDVERNPILGVPGAAVFTDINSDGVPEVLHWPVPATDSLFVPCGDCPKLTYQNLYVERQDQGFVLEDSHLLATGYATFVAFIRRLLDKDRVGASRLLRNPADVTLAIAEGWGVRRGPGTWRIEYVEEGEPWPRWMEARFAGPQGAKRYLIRFGKREDKWVIDNWVVPKAAAPKPRTAR